MPTLRQGRLLTDCPDALTISSILSATIDPDDILCLLCYKAQLKLLSNLQQEPLSDISLMNDIEMWLYTQRHSTSKLTRSILEAIIFVANQLQQEKALLLSSAVTIFIEHYTEKKLTCSISSLNLKIDTEDSTVHFSNRWLLNNLLIYLNKYMSIKCIHKMFGTVLYCRNVDILTSLSWALGSNLSDKEPANFQIDYSNREESQPHILSQSANLINTLLQEEIKRVSNLQESNFSILKFLHNTNHKLVDFL